MKCRKNIKKRCKITQENPIAIAGRRLYFNSTHTHILTLSNNYAILKPGRIQFFHFSKILISLVSFRCQRFIVDDFYMRADVVTFLSRSLSLSSLLLRSLSWRSNFQHFDKTWNSSWSLLKNVVREEYFFFSNVLSILPHFETGEQKLDDFPGSKDSSDYRQSCVNILTLSPWKKEKKKKRKRKCWCCLRQNYLISIREESSHYIRMKTRNWKKGKKKMRNIVKLAVEDNNIQPLTWFKTLVSHLIYQITEIACLNTLCISVGFLFG